MNNKDLLNKKINNLLSKIRFGVALQNSNENRIYAYDSVNNRMFRFLIENFEKIDVIKENDLFDTVVLNIPLESNIKTEVLDNRVVKYILYGNDNLKLIFSPYLKEVYFNGNKV